MGFRLSPYVLVGGAALCLASGTLATDGVIEINQASALAGNPAIGDGTAGFPVTIGLGGSYRLTSDLDLNVLGLPDSAATTAILLTLNSGVSVDIDLNGFAIRGPNNCFSGCNHNGSGNGIEVTAANTPVVRVRNGTVTGAGNYGLYLSAGYSVVEDVRVVSNGASGMYVGYGIVSRSVAAYNGQNGFSIFDAVLRDSFAANNAVRQIDLESGTIADCSVEGGGSVIRISRGGMHGTYVKTSGGTALTCDLQCAIYGNKFFECSGVACLGGVGTILETPVASNMCGSEDCVP